MASPEERINALEQDFKIADYKLDTLIDSVKEVSSAVNKLAEVSTAQTLIQQRLGQVIQEQAEIRGQIKERAKLTDPIIEQGKTYMTMNKVWGLVGALAFGLIQTVVINVANSAAASSEKMENRVGMLERRVDVTESRISNQRSTSQVYPTNR